MEKQPSSPSFQSKTPPPTEQQKILHLLQEQNNLLQEILKAQKKRLALEQTSFWSKFLFGTLKILFWIGVLLFSWWQFQALMERLSSLKTLPSFNTSFSKDLFSLPSFFTPEK